MNIFINSLSILIFFIFPFDNVYSQEIITLTDRADSTIKINLDIKYRYQIRTKDCKYNDIFVNISSITDSNFVIESNSVYDTISIASILIIGKERFQINRNFEPVKWVAIISGVSFAGNSILWLFNSKESTKSIAITSGMIFFVSGFYMMESKYAETFDLIDKWKLSTKHQHQ